MIFITGDTHGQNDFGKLKDFAKAVPNLTREDYVIIAGDFGAVWSEATLFRDLKPYEELPFTVLFVDGNHENFPLIYTCPVKEWNGGKVHVIRPNILHLMRGQVYEIEGKKIFTFGGGTSIDKMSRRPLVSWWHQELPTEDEVEEGMQNLKKHKYKVDVVITHSCPVSALSHPLIAVNTYKCKAYLDNHVLSRFEEKIKYKEWYFGHYHVDGKISEKMRAVYQEIIPLDKDMVLPPSRFSLFEQGMRKLYEENVVPKLLPYFIRCIYRYIFEYECAIADILGTVMSYETEYGIDVEDSEVYGAFQLALSLLDRDEVTAKKLKQCFVKEYNDYTVFTLLMTDYKQFLTEEEHREIVEKAKKVFDEEAIIFYIEE